MELQSQDPVASGMEIEFQNVTVTRGERKILQGVCGMAHAGQLLAVMGPSGAGKTFLLNTLAGREPLQTGSITYNGVPLNKAMKRKLSYVLQEDTFFPNLTLRETLSFTAMLRLPDKMSKKEKLQRMDKIIDELDIRKCLDTIVGDAWMRGLSGGEKKRASIACEMITDPAIIFMDEPTSGLDYSTAASLVRTLRTITEADNKTVVMTIHQPSSQMFFTFHNLLLLCDGQLAYMGPCRNVIDFFADVGLIMDVHNNPADFILEKLKEGEETKSQILSAAKHLRPHEISRQKIAAGDSSNGSRQPTSPSKRKSSRENGGTVNTDDDVRVSLMDIANDTTINEVGFEDAESDRKWPTGWITQYVQLTLRTFRQSRPRIMSSLKIVESVVLCVLVSLMWFQLPRTEETLRDRMGAIFFTIIHWGFTPLFDAVSSFPMERGVIHKERSAGWYRLSAYYMAKMTSELPLILVQPLIFIVVTYWCVGLNSTVLAFFGSCFTIMINAITGQTIGLLMGIACMDFRKAMAIATIFMMMIMLLGGFYTRNLPFWLDWTKYLSFLHYSFHSVMVLEFTDADPVQCAVSTNASQFSQCLQPNVTHVSSHDVLHFYHIELTFWQYLAPLGLFIVVGRLAGYLVLRFIFKPQSV